MQKITDTLTARLLLWGTILILALIPFHATLTVWLASLGAPYTAVRLWKEAILLGLVGLAITLLVRFPELRIQLVGRKFYKYLYWLIGLYVLYHLVAGGIAWSVDAVTPTALGYALISNLRYLAFLIVGLIVGELYSDWIRSHWQQLLLWPVMVVVGFGLLQMYVLPADVLRHVGYGPETIAPYIAVDNKDDFARVQSTLRGPNPLGAYLVIIVTALSALFMTYRHTYARYGLMLLGALLVLYGTYSRSAWIGAAAATMLLSWMLLASVRARKYLLLGGGIVLVLGAASVYMLRDNDYVQNVLFHTNEHSRSATSSNENRASALMNGARDIVREPLGRGPGTAGPASVYNEPTSRISENYFLQIGQEVGVVGLGLFVGILGLVGRELWRLVGAGDPLSLILLASLLGITLVAMLSHAWSDDTLAYVWWGLAGMALGGAITGAKKREKV